MVNSTAERLIKRSRKIVKIPDPDDEKEIYEFKIRSLSTFELAEHNEIFDTLPESGVVIKKDMNEDDENYKMLKKVILPMMRIFLPMCVMEPKITFSQSEESVDPPIVHIGDIPMPVSSALFKEILDLSGVSKEAEERRKKKANVVNKIPSIRQ